MLTNLSIEKLKGTHDHNKLDFHGFSVLQRRHSTCETSMNFAQLNDTPSFRGLCCNSRNQESKTTAPPAVKDEEAWIFATWSMDKCCASWLKLCDT